MRAQGHEDITFNGRATNTWEFCDCDMVLLRVEADGRLHFDSCLHFGGIPQMSGAFMFGSTTTSTASYENIDMKINKTICQSHTSQQQ